MPEERTEALELYKSYIETISGNEAKRLQANATYVGFTGALVTVATTVPNIGDVTPPVLGLFLSVIWFFTIKHHRDLAKAKFQVLKTLEDDLAYRPFQQEWEAYKTRRWPVSLTMIEMLLPLALGLSCIGFVASKPLAAFVAELCLKTQ